MGKSNPTFWHGWLGHVNNSWYLDINFHEDLWHQPLEGEIKLFPAAGGRCFHVKPLPPAYEEPGLIRNPALVCDNTAARPPGQQPTTSRYCHPEMENVCWGLELWLSPADGGENDSRDRKKRPIWGRSGHILVWLSDKLKCGFLDKESPVSGFCLQRYDFIKKKRSRTYKMAHM